MTPSNVESKKKLLELIEEVVNKDLELREHHQIREKFRFIRDRLLALKSQIEENLILSKEQIKTVYQLAEDETLIFVYLFNAQGLYLTTWQKMINPNVFYEYSINRPIYANKADIEAYIRSKESKAQHGYLTFAIEKKNIANTSVSQDFLGHCVLKIKEGSLNPKKLIYFTHQNQDYVLSEKNELIKKEDI